MSDQVTIKLDSRVFYLVVAVIAVLGIFAIGYWLGNQLNEQEAAAPPPDSPAAVADLAPQGSVDVDAGAPVVIQPGEQGEGASMGAGDTVQINPGSQAVAAGKPVSIEELPAGESEPRLWLEDLEETNWVYDFGKIPAGEPTEKDFIVTNTGNAELVIQEATASCGCTAALVENPNLGPGETTVIRVSYDPRVNREAGKFIQKQVRIKSNDPLVPLAEFTISADVAAE